MGKSAECLGNYFRGFFRQSANRGHLLGEIKWAALRTQIVAKATSCLIDCCLSFLASNQVFGGK